MSTATDPIADGRKLRVVRVPNLPAAGGVPESDALRDLHHRGWTLFDRILEENRKTGQADMLLYVMAPPPNPDFAAVVPEPKQIEALAVTPAPTTSPIMLFLMAQMVVVPMIAGLFAATVAAVVFLGS